MNLSNIYFEIPRKNDFEKNGSFTDRYFNINSRNYPKSMWFLLSLDEEMPKNIDKNDSVALARSIIDSWAIQQLLLIKA